MFLEIYPVKLRCSYTQNAHSFTRNKFYKHLFYILYLVAKLEEDSPGNPRYSGFGLPGESPLPILLQGRVLSLLTSPKSRGTIVVLWFVANSKVIHPAQ